MSHSDKAIDTFAVSRDRIQGGAIRGLASLVGDDKVRMTLDDYYAIGCEMQRLRREVGRLEGVVAEVKRAVE